MPTLVWMRRPDAEASGTSGAGDNSSATRRAASVFDVSGSVISASAVPDKRHDGGNEKKRKINSADDAAQKEALVRSSSRRPQKKRDLPQGVHKSTSGKFRSILGLGGKNRSIGTFDTPEQASFAYMSVKRDLDDAKLSAYANRSAFGPDEVNAAFVAASKKAAEAVGGIIPGAKIAVAISGRDLPQGVHKTEYGTYKSWIKRNGKNRYIGCFDTPEQASAALVLMEKDLDDANLSVAGANEVNAAFDAAKTKALKAVDHKRKLPRGVRTTTSGKFEARIAMHGSKARRIGSFDTREQASAAYMSVRKELDDAKLSASDAEKVHVNAIFDAASKKAMESFGGFVPEIRDLPPGVKKTKTGRYQSTIKWVGRTRFIGTFDTPEHASAAFMSVRKDLDDAKLSGISAQSEISVNVEAVFGKAKKKALETVRAMTDSNEHGNEFAMMNSRSTSTSNDECGDEFLV